MRDFFVDLPLHLTVEKGDLAIVWWDCNCPGLYVRETFRWGQNDARITVPKRVSLLIQDRAEMLTNKVECIKAGFKKTGGNI